MNLLETNLADKKNKDVSENAAGADPAYPNYPIVTDMNAIPFENDIQKYTEKQITMQKRQLIKNALSHGLKLKSLDESLADQRSRMIMGRTQKSQEAQFSTKSKSHSNLHSSKKIQ